MNERIAAKIQTIKIGHVTTLWGLLVWRVSETSWVVGHMSIRISDAGMSIEDAVAKILRLMD